MFVFLSLFLAAVLGFVPGEAGAAWNRSLQDIRSTMDAGGPAAALEAFLELPYRNDGAVEGNGVYTLFADPARRFESPGLNCSGFVLAACRIVLRTETTVEQAKRDRLGDSGPGSPHGEDWDFGWDVIMNVSEGFSRRFLIPGNKTIVPEQSTGFKPLGYDIQEQGIWRELPDRLLPGRLYLVSLSMKGRLKGYGLQHYHVGLIHVAPGGEAWFYQTTGKGGGVNRRDLKSAEGQASFVKAFGGTGDRRKKMLVLEVDMP